MKYLLLLLTPALLATTGCTNRTSDHPSLRDRDDDDGSEEISQGRKGAGVVKFVKHQVIDKEGTGAVASTYLLPAGWEVKDKLFWEYRDPTVPVRYQNISKSSDGSMMIQIFADQGRSWSTGPTGTQGYPPPAGIVEGLKFMITTERKGAKIRYVDSKVLSRASSPDNGQGATASGEAGVVKVEYIEDGELMEEEFYGQLDISDVRTQTALGGTRAIVWRASSLYSCKAPKGRLAECRKIAQTMKSSALPTKRFFNRLMQVMQLLSDQYYQSIFEAGQLSKIISQTNDQMLANIDATYRQTQKANDRINNQFSDYIRGVDTYTDNDGSTVKLPSGYREAWVNNQGEYLVSNTNGYDPSEDFKGNWRQLERDR